MSCISRGGRSEKPPRDPPGEPPKPPADPNESWPWRPARRAARQEGQRFGSENDRSWKKACSPAVKVNGRPHSTQLNVRSWRSGTGILSFPELVRHAHRWLPRVSDYNAQTPVKGLMRRLGAAGPQVGIANSVRCARETGDSGRVVTVVDCPPRLQAALPRVARCYVRYPTCREMSSGTR